jgi:hypothetical protein
MEAYNVPSFGKADRRRKGCVMDTNDIKTSTDPYDPYQDFTRGEMASFTSTVGGNGHTVPTKPNGATPANRPYAPPFRSPVEGSFDSVPAHFKAVEGFQSTPNSSTNDASGLSRGPTLPKYYSGYSQDRKYYCDSYNICPSAEGFQNRSVAQPQKAAGISVEDQERQPKCTGPLIAPNYEYPMTDEARAQYNRALQVSLNQKEGATQMEDPGTFMKASGSKHDLVGYTDADLDSFLNTQDMKSATISIPTVPKDDRPVEGRDPYESPFAETMKNFTGPNGTPQLRPASAEEKPDETRKTDPWERVWDMALFVVAGLLLVLLLDQLFKLAMLYGMKRAFLAIEPLLERVGKD